MLLQQSYKLFEINLAATVADYLPWSLCAMEGHRFMDIHLAAHQNLASLFQQVLGMTSWRIVSRRGGQHKTMEVHKVPYEPLSKLLVSPLISPKVIPYIIP